MELQLFISRGFLPCRDAERIWRQVAHANDIRLTIVDVHSPVGRELAARIPVTVVPAIVAAGRLFAIGVQTPDEARDLVATLTGANTPNSAVYNLP